MILYLSGATAYSVYNDLFEKGFIHAGYQAQKFNHTLIKGLANFDKVVSVSALPYANVKAEPIRYSENNVDYYTAGNDRGIIRKLKRLFYVKNLAKKIIKKQRPDFIFCDAIVAPCSLAAISLGKKYKIPTVAIVTDVPEAMVDGGIGGFSGKITTKYMKKYDYYVLLTKDMNDVVNPFDKPHIVMEGVCDPPVETDAFKPDKKIITYTGSLWKNDAGLEYFTDGFIKANLGDVELHYYGTGEFTCELEKISSSHPNVKYMGCVTNDKILQIQSSASLLVNPRPSGEEFTKYSFPSKTFEYMASGTPVLMTKLKGVPDEYFSYVYTIDEETPDGVCRVLREIFAKPEREREEFGKKAKEFVTKNKNLFVQAKKILDFLKG